MRYLTLLVIAVASGLSAGQNAPQDGSCAWMLSKSDTVQTIVEVSWKWVRQGLPQNASQKGLWCTNYCNGEKHILHEQCDLSCDRTCNAIHRGEITPTGGYAPLVDTLEESFAKFGVADAKERAHAVQYSTRPKLKINELVSDPNNALSFNFTHWNQAPCSYNIKYFKTQLYLCTIEYKLKRVTKQPDGSEVTTLGPVTVHKCYADVPVPGSIHGPVKPTVACACTIVREGDDEYGMLQDESGQDTGVACVSNGITTLLDGQQLASMGLAFQGEDMNTFTVTVANKPPDCERLIIPAGFEFVCSDGSAQDTLLAKDFEFVFVAGSSVGVQAPRGPFDFLAPEARTLCLNIDKREPSPGKKYTLSMPRDPGTLRLARMSNSARFFGPWDQVRLWILTDRASMDEIGKVLIPGPSASMYLRELHTLVEERLIELDPKADAKIADSKLLTALAPEADALEWFVGWKMKNDRAGTLKFVRSAAKAMAAHFEGRDPMGAAEGVANLAASLSRHGDDALAAALDLFADKALAPYVGPISEQPSFGALLAALAETEDAAIAGRLLDFAEKHPGASTTVACLNVNPTLPQAVRDRAAKIAKG